MGEFHSDPSSEDTVQEFSIDELAARFFGPSAPAVRAEFGAISHPGKVRTSNEDHFAVVRRRRSRDVVLTNLPDGFLPPSEDIGYGMAVADGVGGAVFGELASMIALRTAWDLTSSAFKWPFKMSEQEAKEMEVVLQLYGQLIHRKLVDRGEVDPRTRGMGTTITGAMTVGAEAFIAHVGDSRAYLFRGGELQRLTRDHTLAQQLVDAGAISSLAEASRVMRNTLVNCLGGHHREQIEVDVHRVELADGDSLLLCTDGLTDMVPEDEIGAILTRPADPPTTCRALVQKALDHGGRDNVTVVLARFAMNPQRLSS